MYICDSQKNAKRKRQELNSCSNHSLYLGLKNIFKSLELDIENVSENLANIYLPGSEEIIGNIYKAENEIGFEFKDSFSNIEPKFPKTLILPDLAELSQGFLGLRGFELWKSVFIPAILEIAEDKIFCNDRKLWINY